MSQNKAVTTLRSSATGRAGGALRGEPHSSQNFAPSRFSTPQKGHVAIGGGYSIARDVPDELRAVDGEAIATAAVPEREHADGS
jgi:hypothetical protein